MLSRFLAILFMWGGVARAEEIGAEEIPQLRKAAQAGDTEAQYKLGMCFFEGSGVKADRARAVQCFRIAAKADHPKAQFQLGNCFANGWGVAKDKTIAAEWYKKAEKQGVVKAPDYLTADNIKARWIADLPVPRTMDRTYYEVSKRNAQFRSEVESGKHDLRAAIEAATHNKGEAIRVGDEERARFYAAQIVEITPANPPTTSGLSLSNEDAENLKSVHENAAFRRTLNVSFKTEKGWTLPVSKTVSFISDEEADDPLSGCALFPASDNSIVVVKVGIFDHLGYLFAFIPSGAVTGKELASGPEREWLLAAQWPAPQELHGDLSVGVLAAVRKNDRATAAEFKMMLGEKERCMAQLRMLKRDFLRNDDDLSASRVGVFLHSQP